MINDAYTFGNAALKIPPDLSVLPPSIRFTDGERRAFKSREKDPRTGLPLTVSQWAERYRIVTGGSMPGKWKNENAPYAVEPMNCWTVPSIREIYLCFAPQVVKTQIAFNCLGYSIDQDPGAAMYVMPDEKTTKRIARRRILPMIKASSRLASLLSPRNDDTTTLAIRFVNGMDLMMAWATSVAEISSEDVRYFIGDEVSKWPGYSGVAEKKEAHPWYLGKIRTNTYPHTKKILALSTPGAAPCLITELIRYEADEIRRYKVPCLACGHEQIMSDEYIVVLKKEHDPRVIERKKLARYSCKKCGFNWDDHMRNQSVLRGKWVSGVFNENGEWEPADPIVRPRSVAFHLPAWYSVFESLSDVAAARIRGEDNPKKRMVYITQKCAEEYKEVVPTKKEENILAEHRTALPSGIVPAKATALVAGIDSHTWGYRFVVYACIEDALGFTLQKIHHGILGSLADVEVLVYHARYQIENSANTLGIWRAAIDTGGNKPGPNINNTEKTMTDEIYEWLREQPRGVIYGVKGASHKQQQHRVKLTVIDSYPHSNKLIPGGLEIRILDVDQFKVLFHWRLTRGTKMIKNPDGTEHAEFETQRILFDADTDNDFVRELLAEELRVKRNGHTEWVRVRSANHYLDCTVYALAAMDAEWQPSLKIILSEIKRARAKKTQPAEAAPPPRRESNEETTGFNRPDMGAIRERLSERFNR
jgi:phage terminase large subunit GpA-like protein